MPEVPITPETLSRVAAEMLRSPLRDSEAALLAPLLRSLDRETRAMREMDVSDVEPALLYEARP